MFRALAVTGVKSMEDQSCCNCRETRVRCEGACFRTISGTEKRCHAYGRHEWCENYMVRLSLGKPEFFKEKAYIKEDHE